MKTFIFKNILFAGAAIFAIDFGVSQLPSASEGFFTSSAEARGFRGGGAVRAGGVRVSATTSVRAAGGVARPAAAVGRYHRPVARPPIYRPGVPGYVPGGTAGVARRSVRRVARRTANRVAYRTATGLSYYYGAPVYTAPPACVQTFWEGQYVLNCGGAIYITEVVNGVTTYYPIETM